MKPPIFVYEPFDLMIFETKELAEKYLEADIVKDYDYYAWDSNGTTLDFIFDGNRVEIIQFENSKIERNKLKEIIIQTFINIGIDPQWCENATWEELIQKSLDYTIE